MNWKKWLVISGFLATSLIGHAADKVVPLTAKRTQVGVLDQADGVPVTSTIEVIRTAASPQFPSLYVKYRYLADICTHYHWVGWYPYSYQVCDRWEKRVVMTETEVKLRFWNRNKLDDSNCGGEERFLLNLQQVSFDSSQLNLTVDQTKVVKPYRTYIVPEGWRALGVSFRN